MNSEDYARIGRQKKRENPGCWDGNTDEEVGVVHVKANSLHMPDIEIDARTHLSEPLSLNTEPFGLLSTRIKHFDKQIEHIGRQVQKQIAIDTAEFTYSHHQQHLQQQHSLQVASYVLNMLTMHQQAEVKQLAKAHGLDDTKYLEWRVALLNMDVSLTQLAETNRLNAKHTAELDRLKREDEAERATTRVRVMTTASMADLQREKQLREQLAEARRKRFSIEHGGDPPALKQSLLKDEDDYIASLEEKISEFRKGNRQADSRTKTGGDA